MSPDVVRDSDNRRAGTAVDSAACPGARPPRPRSASLARRQRRTDRPAGPASDQPARLAADPAATFCGPRCQRATDGAKDGSRPREPARGQQDWGRIDLDAAVTEADPARTPALRMGTYDAKQRYQHRAAAAETVNADAKTHRGRDPLPVRGLAKALGCATRFALTHDILRFFAVRGYAVSRPTRHPMRRHPPRRRRRPRGRP